MLFSSAGGDRTSRCDGPTSIFGKVVADLEYRPKTLLSFPQQRCGGNFNGQGDFGSQVVEALHHDGRDRQIPARLQGAGFTVSNDLLKGNFLIDVSVEAKMDRGAAGSTFEIKLYDLPEKKTADLFDTMNKTPIKANVVIKLGYMDGDFETVMEGIYSDVTSHVEGDNLVTTIKGEENGTYALRHTFSKRTRRKHQVSGCNQQPLKDAPIERPRNRSALGIGGTLASLPGMAQATAVSSTNTWGGKRSG
jgi:hypothetical protein